MPGEAAMLPGQLRHVRWIGGGSGAGKSTIARLIAARRGLRVYSADDVMRDHGRRITPEDAPLLAAFAAMSMDERWVRRSPEQMLATFHWFQGEAFGLIIEDLLSLPDEPGIIAEGFRLLPDLVAPLLSSPDQAVWLLPTPRFRRSAFESRGSLLQIAGQTSDPGRALQNLLERDRLFTACLGAATRALRLRAIEVDLPVTEDALATLVAGTLGL